MLRPKVAEVEESARSDFRRKNQPLVLQGSLNTNALAEVFGKLYSEKATGGLLLRSGKIKDCSVSRRQPSQCEVQSCVRMLRSTPGS